MAKMGRRKADNPKNLVLQIRMDKETADKLGELATHYALTKADVLRKGIDRLYADMKKE